jgi:hypothetical protein
MTSPLRIHFSSFNPTEIRSYRLTCIISLSGNKLYYSTCSNLSLGFVMYTYKARLLQATRCWQALK